MRLKFEPKEKDEGMHITIPFIPDPHLKPKHWVVLIFILFALFDMATFTGFTVAREGYSNQEFNPIFRFLGYWPMLIAYVALHAMVIYAYLRPWYRSRHAVALMASIIAMACFIHLFGGLSNIYGYLNPPKDNTQPTMQEMTYAGAIIMLYLGVLMTTFEGCFYFYFTVADEYPLENSKNDFIKADKYPRLSAAYNIFDYSVRLVIMMVLLGVIGVVLGRVINLLPLPRYWDCRVILGVVGVLAAIKNWADNVVKAVKVEVKM